MTDDKLRAALDAAELDAARHAIERGDVVTFSPDVALRVIPALAASAPDEGEFIGSAILTVPPDDTLRAALDEADDFNERSHHGAFYGGWKRAIKHVRAALAASAPDEGLTHPCWFCKRMVSVDALIAGYDTFEEQRLACMACNEIMSARPAVPEALDRLTPILDAAEASVAAGTLPVDVLNITQPVRHAIEARPAVPAALDVERLREAWKRHNDGGECTIDCLDRIISEYAALSERP